MKDLREDHEKRGKGFENLLAPSGLTDRRLPLYAYTPETIRMLLIPMLTTGKEALGLSHIFNPLQRSLKDYFYLQAVWETMPH